MNDEIYEKIIRIIGFIAATFLFLALFTIYYELGKEFVRARELSKDLFGPVLFTASGLTAILLWAKRFQLGLLITVFVINIIDLIRSVLTSLISIFTWFFKKI